MDQWFRKPACCHTSIFNPASPLMSLAVRLLYSSIYSPVNRWSKIYKRSLCYFISYCSHFTATYLVLHPYLILRLLIWRLAVLQVNTAPWNIMTQIHWQGNSEWYDGWMTNFTWSTGGIQGGDKIYRSKLWSSGCWFTYISGANGWKAGEAIKRKKLYR